MNITTIDQIEYMHPQIDLSTILQYIIVISISTSIFTTCCVICTGYYCSRFRTRLRLQYINKIASDDSSTISSVSDSEKVENDVFWFEDIYQRRTDDMV
jgi:hypothetical protein